MRCLIILLFIPGLQLLAQSGFPDYSAEIFRNDTVNLTMYSIDLPSGKKAELYANAETWAIQKSIYSSDSDTIGKDRSGEEQKRECEKFKQQFSKSDEYLKVMFYFLDLNQDNRTDIIKICHVFYNRKGVPDSILKLNYPSVFDDSVTFFISTKNNYYNKYFFPGGLNSLEKLNKEFHFSCISNSCCDESAIRIDKFTIPSGTGVLEREYSIWADDQYAWRKPGGYFLPENFAHAESYRLKEDELLYTGVYHCQEGGRMSIPFKKDEQIRVVSEKGEYYLVEFEIRKSRNECVPADSVYFLRWWKKTDFEKIARKIE